MSCFWNLLESAFLLSTDVYANSLGGFVVHHTHHSEVMVCGDRVNIIQYLSLCYRLRYPVVGTFRSLLWAVLHNERISRDKKNLINLSSFSLLFVYLPYVYRCFNLLSFYLCIIKDYVLRLIAHELTSDIRVKLATQIQFRDRTNT